MSVNIDTLKKAILKKGYKWFDDQLNVIGVRTKLQVPDAFNDLLFIVYKEADIEKLYTATITTDPGTTYQKNPLNSTGCAVLLPGQYINSHKLGFHQGKPDHRALVQVGKLKVARDNDKDGIAETDGSQENGLFGINIHGAYHKNGIDETKVIGPWSAGCQVHSRWSKKEEMCDIAETYKNVNKGLITYTLLEEKDLV